MQYRIEVNRAGSWEDDIGDRGANYFDTEADAVDLIPQLARIFECDKTDFRVVEVS